MGAGAFRVDATKLREFLDQMHAHADVRDARTKSIAGVVTDARTVGYDGKTLRKIFVRERMDAEKRQRDDDLLDVYETALGPKGRALQAIASGATLDQAAEASGVSRATVARAVGVAKQGQSETPAHDPETGEIHEVGEATSLAAAAGRPSEPSAPAEQSVNLVSPPRPSVAVIDGGEGARPGTDSTTAVLAVPPGDGTGTAVASSPAPAVANSSCGQPDLASEAGARVETVAAPGPQDIDWDAINAGHPKELRGSRQQVAA